MVDLDSLTTELNGRGIMFTDFFYNAKSHVLPLIFYSEETLYNPGTDLKPKDIDSSMVMMEDGYTIKWQDVDWRRPTAAVSGAVSGAATKIDVATGQGAYFMAGDQILSPTTNEVFVVTAVSTDELTVTPAVAAGGIADTVPLLILSHAIDNAGSVSGKASKLQANTEQSNYIKHSSWKVEFTQEKLNSVLLRYTQMGVSESQAAQNYIKESIQKVKQEVIRDILLSLYQGRKATATIGGNTYRYCGGIEEYMDSTVVDVNAETTTVAKLKKLIEAFDDVAKLAPPSKIAKAVLVVDDKAFREINSWVDGLNLERYTKSVTSLGWEINTIKGSYGNLVLMTCPELNTLTTSLAYGTGYIFCPELIEFVGATKMITPGASGDVTNEPTVVDKPGLVFYVPEGSRKQPNSPVTVELYTNYSMILKGDSLDLYKKVKI